MLLLKRFFVVPRHPLRAGRTPLRGERLESRRLLALTATGSQLWHQDVTGIEDGLAEGDRFGFALESGDFDDDGFADLAVGVPGEGVAGAFDAGAVNVIYGTDAGLAATADQFWSQLDSNIQGAAETDDLFGWDLAVGDFDNDDYDDLAIGVPGESVNGNLDAGGVNVIYGSASGLTDVGDQIWNQDGSGVQGVTEVGDQFGTAVEAGDFDGDGFSDLAIGVPGESVNGNEAAGAVNVLYGSAAGLSATGDQIWSQFEPGIEGLEEPGDFFGAALAVGDFDDDGFDDLAIGVPGDSIGGDINAGGVNVLYGSPAGLAAAGDQFWTQDATGMLDAADPFDEFGAALTTGDFDGDGFVDLAIGIPGETVDGNLDAGAVHILFGSASGLTSAGNQFVNQNTVGIEGLAEIDDDFAAALDAADFDQDGFADLVVGVPGDSVDGFSDAGLVQVIRGSSAGLSTVGDQLWNQNADGIADVSENFDRFGAALATGDFDQNGVPDLAIGIPLENFSNAVDGGAVQVLYAFVASGFASDFNGDGVVDGDDFLIWQSGFGIVSGATSADGDADGDGDVDGDDFLVWQTEFGSSSGAAGEALVASREARKLRVRDRIFASEWSSVGSLRDIAIRRVVGQTRRV